MEGLPEVLYNLVNNPSLLAEGAGILSVWRNAPSYAVHLAHILSQNSNPEVQQFAGLELKNFVLDNWEALELSSSDKEKTRSQVMQAILSPHDKVRTAASLALAAIILREYPRYWTNPFDQLFSIATDLQSLDAVLKAICIVFSECDDRLCRAVSYLLPRLYSLMQSPGLSSSMQERILLILHYCMDSLSWADGVDNALLHASLDSTWSNWLSLLLNLLGNPASLLTPYDSGENARSMLALKRFSLRTLTVFFRDYTNYSKEWIGQALHVIWGLYHVVLPNFLSYAVYSSDVQDCWQEEDVGGYEGLAQQLIELISAIVLRPGITDVISNELYPFINTLAWYMQITSDQIDLWSSDPNQFIINDEDEETVKSTRHSALKLLSDLVEKHGDKAVAAALKVVDRLILNFNSRSVGTLLFSNQTDIQELIAQMNERLFTISSSAYSQYIWKTREVALLLTGSISADILSYNTRARREGREPFNLNRFFEELLIKDIMSFTAPDGNKFLKGRALWCVAKFSEIISTDSEMLSHIFILSSQCIAKSQSLAVRLSACYAISKLTRKMHGGNTDKINDMLQELLVNIVDLCEHTNADTFMLSLDALMDVSSLNTEIGSTVPKYFGNTFLNLYRKYFDEPTLSNKLMVLMRYWCDIPESIEPLTGVFIPYVIGILYSYNPQMTDKHNSICSTSTIDSRINVEPFLILPSCLELATLLLKKSTAKSTCRAQIMQILPVLLDILSVTDDIGILIQGTGCLRSFISYAAEDIINQGLLDRIIEVTGLLLNPSKNESGAVHLGYMIIQLFSKLTPRVSQDILMGCVNKLYRSKMPLIVQGLVLVFARLIHSHTSEIIGYLANQSVDRRVALKVLLDKWLIHQPLMRGRYTKNATISALARLYTLKDNRLESLLVVGYNPSHSNVGSEVLAPFKILSTLIRCLDNQTALPKRKQDNFDINEDFQTVVEGSGMGFAGAYVDDEPGARMDTVEDDRYEDEEGEGDPMEALKKDLLKEIVEDFEGQDFKIPESKDKGLADYEIGSECLMSDMLDFDYEEGDDTGEDFYEDDLYSLGDWYGSMNMQNFLLDFFKNLIENDKDYLRACLKHMLVDDIALFKKHFNI